MIKVFIQYDDKEEERYIQDYMLLSKFKCIETMCPPHCPCTDCYVHDDGKNVIIGKEPVSPQGNVKELRVALINEIGKVKTCESCQFFANNKCEFNYNCPADFERSD